MLKRIALASIVLTFIATGIAGASMMGTIVTLHKTSLGSVLATVGGKTLYLSMSDGANASTCTGACAVTWPPLKTTTKPVAGMGVKHSLLYTAKRPGGNRLQVTYNGHPLYTYTGDSAPGQVNGEGVDGNWFVVTAAGNKK